jgi:hypothetical protein
MNLEIVTLVSGPTEMTLLRKHLIDRRTGVPLTVLVRPGIHPPAGDTGSIQVVPIGGDGLVENALQEYAKRARGAWLLQVDPDELWPVEAFRRAEELAGRLGEREAAEFPMTYFIGSRPLRGGPWGRVYQQRLNSAASLMRFPGEVHMRPPASRVERVTLTTAVQHFWVKDLAQLRSKHNAYLRKEGAARIARFGPYRPHRAAVRTARTVAGCIRSAPWKDGILGIRLAAEMVRYQHKANAAWRQETERRSRSQHTVEKEIAG